MRGRAVLCAGVARMATAHKACRARYGVRARGYLRGVGGSHPPRPRPCRPCSRAPGARAPRRGLRSGASLGREAQQAQSASNAPCPGPGRQWTHDPTFNMDVHVPCVPQLSIATGAARSITSQERVGETLGPVSLAAPHTRGVCVRCQVGERARCGKATAVVQPATLTAVQCRALSGKKLIKP